MLAGAAFADVLEATLHATPSMVGALGREQTAATPPLSAPPFRAQWNSAVGRSTYRHAARTGGGAGPATPRPARALDPGALEALDVLRGFGASLDSTFNRAELRSTFRALAKRFHPDRHPGQLPHEVKALAGAFNEITLAYTRLLTLSASTG